MKNGKPIGMYNYYMFDENAIYFWKKSVNNSKNSKLDIYILSSSEKAEIMENTTQVMSDNLYNDITPMYNGPISFDADNGLAGRVELANTTNKYLYASVQLPTASEFYTSSTSSAPGYIYGGFSGGKSPNTNIEPTTRRPYSSFTYESDAGLQYSKTYKLWKPYMIVTGSIDKYTRFTVGQTFLSGYDNVTRENGYLPGTKVSMTVHPNNDQIHGEKGSVRLKLVGTTKNPDDKRNYTLTSISETSEVFNFNNVANHKVVATLIGEDTKGQNIARFTGININGTTVPESKMTMYTDKATFSNVKDGNVTITVRN